MIKPNYDLVTQIIEGAASYDVFAMSDVELAALYRATQSWMVYTKKAFLPDPVERETWQYELDTLKHEIGQDIIALWMAKVYK